MKLTTKGHYAIIFWLALSLTPAFAASFQPLGDLPGGSFSAVPGLFRLMAPSLSARAFQHPAPRRFAGPGRAGWSGSVISRGEYSTAPPETYPAMGVLRWENPSAPHRRRMAGVSTQSASGMVGLGYLGGPEFKSIAEAISYDGSLIVGRTTDGEEGRRTAFRWTASEGMVQLTDPSGASYPSPPAQYPRTTA